MCEIWYGMHACTIFSMLLQIFMLFLALAYGCQQRHRALPLTPIDLSDATTLGQVIVDGGLHKLWPCLIPWLGFEATMGYAWLHNLSGRLATSYHIASLTIAVLSCCFVLCCVVLCCVVLRCVALRCVALCCVVLCLFQSPLKQRTVSNLSAAVATLMLPYNQAHQCHAWIFMTQVPSGTTAFMRVSDDQNLLHLILYLTMGHKYLQWAFPRRWLQTYQLCLCVTPAVLLLFTLWCRCGCQA